MRLNVAPFEQHGCTPPLPDLDEGNHTTHHPLLNSADSFAQAHSHIGLEIKQSAGFGGTCFARSERLVLVAVFILSQSHEDSIREPVVSVPNRHNFQICSGKSGPPTANYFSPSFGVCSNTRTVSRVTKGRSEFCARNFSGRAQSQERSRFTIAVSIRRSR